MLNKKMKIGMLVLAVLAGTALSIYYLGEKASWQKLNGFLSMDFTYDSSVIMQAYQPGMPSEKNCELKLTAFTSSLWDYIKEYCTYKEHERCIVIPVKSDISHCPAELSAVVKVLANPCGFIDMEAKNKPINNFWDVMYAQFQCETRPRKATSIQYILNATPVFVAHYK